MKKIILPGFVFFALAVLWTNTSDAQMCGCPKMAGDMPMMGRPMCECGEMVGGMQHKGMDHDMKDDEMLGECRLMMQHLMALELDEKQKEAVRDIKSKTMKETIKKKADMQVYKIELKELLGRYSVDMKAVEVKLKQIEGARTDMHFLHIKALEEIKSHLTAGQKKKFKEMMDSGPMMGGDKGCCIMQHEAGAQPEKPGDKKPAEHKH